MTHTPGPWFWDAMTSSFGCAVGWIGRIEHTRKGDGEFGDPDADGKLIRSAPLLLAACKALIKPITAGLSADTSGEKWECIYCYAISDDAFSIEHRRGCVILTTRNVIASATGDGGE